MTGTRVRLVAVIVVVLVAGVFVLHRRGTSDGISTARHLLQQDARFANGPRAGNTFADLSHVLLSDAKACEHRHSSVDERCTARYSAAAYASVTAFALIECTQPGVYEARRDVLVELDGIVAVDRARGTVPAPRVPNVPTCR